MLVVHDEIDLPFGEIRTRVGGGLAGHNGLKSLERELGGADFAARARRRRAPGLDRPRDRLGYVLGRFREPPREVAELVDDAARAARDTVGE